MLLADRIIPLTPGPTATLGPAFKVDLPRPRDRAALNDGPCVHPLARRNHGQYLMELGATRSADAQNATRAAECPADHGEARSAAGLQQGGALADRGALPRVLRSSQDLPDAEGAADRRRRFRPEDEEGRVRLADRPFRLRQVDGAVDGRRAQRDLERRHRARWPARSAAPGRTGPSSSSRRR